MGERDWSVQQEDKDDAMAAGFFQTSSQLHQKELSLQGSPETLETQTEQVSEKRDRTSKRKKQIAFYLFEEEAEKVKAKAESLNITTNEYLTQLVRKDLKK